MTESAAVAYYAWVWDGERWTWVCFTAFALEIDFGRWGKVVVEMNEQMSVDGE